MKTVTYQITNNTGFVVLHPKGVRDGRSVLKRLAKTYPKETPFCLYRSTATTTVQEELIEQAGR